MTVAVSMDANNLYSRLERNDQSAFEQLAQAMVSQDNSTRKQAEDFYQQLLQRNPDLTLRFLAAGLTGQSDMRHFCCLYLRKVRAQASQKSVPTLTCFHCGRLLYAACLRCVLELRYASAVLQLPPARWWLCNDAVEHSLHRTCIMFMQTAATASH
jgi:hypothetical protein